MFCGCRQRVQARFLFVVASESGVMVAAVLRVWPASRRRFPWEKAKKGDQWKHMLRVYADSLADSLASPRWRPRVKGFHGKGRGIVTERKKKPGHRNAWKKNLGGETLGRDTVDV